MASDTFAEVVEWLNTHAKDFHPAGIYRDQLLKAARLLAAAGEYIKAGLDPGLKRGCSNEPDGSCPSCDASVKMMWARNALTELAPELKEIA